MKRLRPGAFWWLFLLLGGAGCAAAFNAVAWRSPGEGPPPPVRARSDLNHIPERQLAQIEGVGPRLARRITDFRRRFGPLRRPEQVLLVPGLGPARWRRLQRYLGTAHAEPRERRGPDAHAEP